MLRVYRQGTNPVNCPMEQSHVRAKRCDSVATGPTKSIASIGFPV